MLIFPPRVWIFIAAFDAAGAKKNKAKQESRHQATNLVYPKAQLAYRRYIMQVSYSLVDASKPDALLQGSG
jgi:hypothetical protein